MSCIDCFDNCTGEIPTDKCVKYTGPDVPLLGICSGDSLFQIEAILISKLQQSLDGSGISLVDVTLNCAFVTDLLDGKEQTLENLVQVLLDGECSLAASIATLNAAVFAPFSINAPCLTLGTNPTRDQVLQALATKLCSVSTSVDTILADYVKDSELCTKVNACITASTQFNSRMVPYVAYPYHGPLSNFDGSGAGLSANGFNKVYLCVGQTVGVFPVPDYRGRSPIGSNIGVPGGALDANVDPSLPANAGYNITPGVKKGSFTDTLTVPQLASHSHSAIDSGHTHNINTRTAPQSGSATQCYTPSTAGFTTPATITTASATANISVGSAGSGAPHNTTHPTMGCNFIIYIP